MVQNSAFSTDAYPLGPPLKKKNYAGKHRALQQYWGRLFDTYGW